MKPWVLIYLKITHGTFSLGANVNLSYNNYRGIDVQAGLGFAKIEANNAKPAEADTKENPADTTGTKNPQLSLAQTVKQEKANANGQNSTDNEQTKRRDYYYSIARNAGSGTGLRYEFAGLGSRPVAFDHPRQSFSFGLNGKVGLVVLRSLKTYKSMYSTPTKIKGKSRTLPRLWLFVCRTSIQYLQ